MELRYKARTIVNQSGTLYVSIPIEWARNLGLSQGDKIIPCIMSDGKLMFEIEDEC